MTTPEALRHWLHPGLEIDLRVGGAYRCHDPGRDTWISGGTVLEIAPAGALVLSWLEGRRLGPPGAPGPDPTPIAGGARVTLAHDGFAGIGKPGFSRTVEAYERGADRHRSLDGLARLVAAGAAGGVGRPGGGPVPGAGRPRAGVSSTSWRSTAP